MSDINHEAAKEQAHKFIEAERICEELVQNGFKGEATLSRAYLDLDAKLEAANANADELLSRLDTVTASHCEMLRELEVAHAKIEKYQRRLEITHCYDGHTGECKEIPPENRDTHPDGIFCRDATIQLLKDDLTAERQRSDRLAKLEKNYLLYRTYYDLCFPPKGMPASEIETLHDEFLTARDNRLAELEQENAELRARLEGRDNG